MDERVKTSFIPKASLKVEHEKPRGADSVALVNTIAGVIMVIVLVVSAGVFLYREYTIRSIASKKQSLQVSREAFQPATIKELSRLNARIETAKTLLQGHISLSRLFDDLEARTLASVRFSNFAFDGTSSGKLALTMDGHATSFNAVALQSVEFSKSDVITDPIFSNVNINQNGDVAFNFTAVIDGSELIYQGTPSAQATSTQAR
ncbi:MAG: hypothetical protein AAB923_00500 [Patescibacteria group bacterium]